MAKRMNGKGKLLVLEGVPGPMTGAKTCIVKLGVFDPGGVSIFHIERRS